MLVVDTPIISELMRPDPTPQVLDWFDAIPASDLYVTTITEAETRIGLAYMPDGARRRRFAASVDRLFEGFFAGRILTFDRTATRILAEFAAIRRSIGRPLPFADGQIAAIARTHDMIVATRNVKDFDGLHVQLVNPWKS